ncbi:(deoxy)nucleoside triphosphate pyrophosphohydrolase [Algoriphagus aestuariicola]|uniref:8-oxo-dGTP diphosphatase n=1 Tax=Algoriphagus aestuariicola TaxID=1852016 RepID=A0ABS3BKV3_9BACT|nr:(deoxy)nucleoside triphosphate pyrophosphohydrolase [Algoriphagus aestuariicola]MBN7799444.1 (deoxy)nucleoside triphosphate pyrophosphohydrolase [Algoriphagus aestuariicola]
MKTIPVTCALIIHEGKVLAAQRSESMDLPGKWEFPGGKVEEHEDPKECLRREIREELGIEIIVGEALMPSLFSYPSRTIRLLPFIARWKSGEIRMSEHSQVLWLERNSLLSVDWAEADIPIVQELHENWVKLVVSTNAEEHG